MRAYSVYSEAITGLIEFIVRRSGILTAGFVALIAVTLVLLFVSCDKSSAGLTAADTQSLSKGDSVESKAGTQNGDTDRHTQTVTLYDAIQTVDAYTVTGDSGVSVDALKCALKDSLAAGYKGRFTSDVATGDAARVRDIAYDMDSQTLSWTYANDGDYDLDGSVGVPDITPIAENYLATVEYSEETYDDGRPVPAGDPSTVDGAANWYKAFLDTDRGGDIGISDITAIADNYLNEVAGYAVFVENDPTLPVDDWRKITDIDLDDAKSNLPTDIYFPVPFAQTVTETDGHFALVRPYDSTGKLGDASDIVVLSNTVIPQAYAVVPADGITGDVTTFVAVTTGLMPFDWYWNFGAAAFPSTSSKENPTVILGNPGEYDCSVRVTNPYGSAYFVFTITVDDEPVPPPPPVTAFAVPGAYPEQYGDAPFTATFSCNKSYSTAGDIILYEWDFETDGVIDVTQEQPYHVTHEFLSGEYITTLYVTDEVNYRASATLFIVALSNDTQWETVYEVNTSNPLTTKFDMYNIFFNPKMAGLLALTYEYRTKLYFQYEQLPGIWSGDSFDPPTNIGPIEWALPIMANDGSVYWCGVYQPLSPTTSHICYIKRDSEGNWFDVAYVDIDVKNTRPDLAVSIHPNGYPAFIYRVGSSRDILRYAYWDTEENWWKIETTGIPVSAKPYDFRFINGNPMFLTIEKNLVLHEKIGDIWNSSYVTVNNGSIGTQLLTTYIKDKLCIIGVNGIYSYVDNQFGGYWNTTSFSFSIHNVSNGLISFSSNKFIIGYPWSYEPFRHIRYNLFDFGKYDDLTIEENWESSMIAAGDTAGISIPPLVSFFGTTYVVVESRLADESTLLSIRKRDLF